MSESGATVQAINPTPTRLRDAGQRARAAAAPPVPDAGTAAATETSAQTNDPEESSSLDLETARRIWPQALDKVPYKYNWRLSQVEPVAVADPNILVVAPKPGYSGMDEAVFSAETSEALGASLQKLIRRPVQVRFQSASVPDDHSQDKRDSEPRRPDALTSEPLVQKVVELFEARPVQMDYDDGADESASR